MTPLPAVPELSTSDVRAELEALFKRGARAHRSLDTAFYGRGQKGEVQVSIGGQSRSYRVVPVDCELRLRQELAESEAASGVPVALLVDYTINLPCDVSGRLASGKVRFVDPAKRLARRFQARAVSPAVLASPLKRALVDDARGDYAPISGRVLDLATAWRRFMERHAGLTATGAIGEDRILAFCATSDRGAAFLEYASKWAGVREAWQTWLRDNAGPVAAAAWGAWENGRGAEVGALALLAEASGAAARGQGYVRAWLKERALAIGVSLDVGPDAVARTVARWEAAAKGMLLRLDVDAADALVALADGWTIDPEIVQAVAQSSVLSAGWNDARSELAARLRELVEAHDADAGGAKLVAAATATCDALERLLRHRLAGRNAQQRTVDRATMGVRLATWLAHRATHGGLEDLAKAPPYEGMVRTAERYAQEGGFVDLARRVARGGGEEALGLAIDGVVTAADRVRDEDDERFARGINAWRAAGQPSDRVVPIHDALDRLAASFLKQHEHRRVLVALMDGMAWANAVELALDLESSLGVAPLAWRPPRQSASRLLPPVVASLPTMTDISRAAFFAGKPYGAGATQVTAKDPQRFASHRALEREETEVGGPMLLLSKAAFASSGAMTAEGRELVRSQRRVVGVVLNAIDDQLKGSREVRVAYGVGTIKPLEELLSLAMASGRAVLMVADHGHVTSSRMGPARPQTATSTRWRWLPEGAEPEADEVVVSGKDIPRGPGGESVAMLFRETDTFKAMRHEGAHGGCSLAEAIAPALLMADSTLADTYASGGVEDPQAQVTPLPRPAWWNLEAPRQPVKTVTKKRAAPAPSPATRQLSLLDEPVAPEPEASKAAGATTEAARLVQGSPWFADRSKADRKKLVQEVVPLVDRLAAHGGRLSRQRFAEEAKVMPFMVGGVVARMAEWLNVEGYAVVVDDVKEKQVVLDLELLRQIHGEEEGAG